MIFKVAAGFRKRANRIIHIQPLLGVSRWWKVFLWIDFVNLICGVVACLNMNRLDIDRVKRLVRVGVAFNKLAVVLFGGRWPNQLACAEMLHNSVLLSLIRREAGLCQVTYLAAVALFLYVLWRMKIDWRFKEATTIPCLLRPFIELTHTLFYNK